MEKGELTQNDSDDASIGMESMGRLKITEENETSSSSSSLTSAAAAAAMESSQSQQQIIENEVVVVDGGVQITCFSELSHDNHTTLHFQIIRLHKQIYAWIGCNSAKFGHLYAAAPTRPNTASVTSLLGGASDNTGSGIARRLVLKTGLNIIVACNIPKNSPMVEADAEKMLVQKLINLGYTRPKSTGSSS